jgi:hypothetical protein
MTEQSGKGELPEQSTEPNQPAAGPDQPSTSAPPVDTEEFIRLWDDPGLSGWTQKGRDDEIFQRGDSPEAGTEQER